MGRTKKAVVNPEAEDNDISKYFAAEYFVCSSHSLDSSTLFALSTPESFEYEKSSLISSSIYTGWRGRKCIGRIFSTMDPAYMGWIISKRVATLELMGDAANATKRFQSQEFKDLFEQRLKTRKPKYPIEIHGAVVGLVAGASKRVNLVPLLCCHGQNKEDFAICAWDLYEVGNSTTRKREWNGVWKRTEDLILLPTDIRFD